ncbi:MAG: hypothetical protein N3A65_01630 [candidate division WOR-3 bacterium]|nr:hypothetical protein [candidate division WOR-3 bacterium]
MIVSFFLLQSLNPYLSVNILIPDNYTDDYLGNIYQLGLENDFFQKMIGLGIYLDYFYKKEYPYDDLYFSNQVFPVLISAGGGLQI